MIRHKPIASTRTPRGVALLTVLMTLVLIAAIAAAGRAQTGAGLAALERDIATTRARWRAEGCVQQAIAILNDAVHSRRDTAWNYLDLALAGGAPLLEDSGCDVALEPIGRVRDVNSIDSVGLVRLFRAAGIAAQRCDSLTAAILDWSDPDTSARLAGAERPWYLERNRPAPRDGRLRNKSELRLVRGFEDAAFAVDTILTLLGADSVRVDLSHAPLPVLLSIAGLPEPIARELDRTRASRTSAGGLTVVSGVGGVLGLTAVAVPESWRLVVRAHEQGLTRPFSTRVRLGRASDRVGVLAVEEDR